MKHFKKKTIALVLASVVTVVGSFAAENYRNSLMNLTFKSSPSGTVNMVVQTKMPYSGNVNPVKKDANTYVLMLPEMDSEISTPDLSEVGGIDSVNIRTMPYSNNAKGYTRITIKTTVPSLLLSGTSQLYIRDNESGADIERTVDDSDIQREQQEAEMRAKEESLRVQQEEDARRAALEAKREREERARTQAYERELASRRDAQQQQIAQESKVLESNTVEEKSYEEQVETSYSKLPDNKQDSTYLLLWAIVIVLLSAFFYIKAREKMTEIAGESLDIDVEEEKKETKKKNKDLSKIKNTIKTLDKAYSRTSGFMQSSEYTQPVAQSTPAKVVKPAEALNVVDLDQLFKEQKNKSPEELDEENLALEEFLSGFSFDEEFYNAEQEEQGAGYDEAYYDEIIKNNKLTFSKDDVSCINKLLGSEINDDTMRDIAKYAMTSPIKKPSKKQILENLVTSYAISQNLIFTKEDVQALYKLINVEIDSDFVTDLRTNPKRVAEMQKDILDYGDKPKKPSEIVTLSVGEMLPDLSDALKKQGNRKIESEHKAETIYFTEGYDVKTLSLDAELPDLTKEVNNKGAYVSKPSASYDIVDNSYVVGDSELKISVDLPDLQDVMAHPEKYAKPDEEHVEADADALLNSIANVQFKPFDDGTREFEVINEFDIPTVSDIQEEFSQFAGFEITQEEPTAKDNINDDYNDFESLFNNEYVDLDKEQVDSYEVSVDKPKDDFVPLKLERNIEPARRERKTLPDSILQKINQAREERKMKNDSTEKVDKKQGVEVSAPSKCILEGESFVVVSSVNLLGNTGCYLAKNDNGYVVIGYNGNKLNKVKTYSTLKSEKIQARLSDKISEETQRFLIRIGMNKFIVDVTNGDVNYVMDLC